MPRYKNNTLSTVYEHGLVIPPGAEIDSLKFFQNLTNINPAPYFPIVLGRTEYTAAAPGQEMYTNTINQESKELMVEAVGTAVTVRANHDLNPYYFPIPADATLMISHERNIEKLYLSFSAAGKCVVTEIP